MTITFRNDNDVILYTLETIIFYTTKNLYIVVTQCVWWQLSIIRLEQGLIIHINNLWIRLKAIHIPCTTHFTLGNLHSDRVSQINSMN